MSASASSGTGPSGDSGRERRVLPWSPSRPDHSARSEISGTVVETSGGSYVVRSTDGRDLPAVLRGKLKQGPRPGDRVVPGDRVRASAGLETDPLAIEEVLARSNELVRAGPGGRRAKVVAANLDRCIVAFAVQDPAFDRAHADRFLALAATCGIPATLVLNKVDLPPAREIVSEVVDVYGLIGYDVIATSALTGEGLERLGAVLERETAAIIGPSGVGKSSLLNQLAPGWDLKTGPLGASGRGRQTTVSSRLLPLEGGGWLADTPGFSDVGLWDVDAGGLDAAFPEFLEPGRFCRFSGCSHVAEPDCGVRAAIETGMISPSRYESYVTMRNEVVSRAARP